MRRTKSLVAWLMAAVLCLEPMVWPIATYADNASAEQDAKPVVVDPPAGQNEQQGTTDDDASEPVVDTPSESASDTTDSQVEPQSSEDTSETLTDDSSLSENSWRYQNGVSIVTDNGIATYSLDSGLPNGVYGRGVDVSNYQGSSIDWVKVKASGIKFAFFKIGPVYGRIDSTFERNASECERLGIPYGVYYYTYARSVADAQRDASRTLTWLGSHNPQLPVYYDVEDKYILEDPQFSVDKLTEIVQTYCDTISAAGLETGIYANLNWFNNYLNSPKLANYDHWIAQYNYRCDYSGNYSYWQYSSSGNVPGISGNVDMNYAYAPIPGEGQSVCYQTHVSDIGWMSVVSNGVRGGTTGRSKGLEDIKVYLSNAEASGSIEVNAHVSNIGWQGWDKPSASEGGTTGQSKHIEALQFRLTGEMANLYDVYYRVHASNIGWMGWAKDGESAGTQGYGRQLEAVQIKLVKKGESAPSNNGAATTDTFRRKPVSLSYRAHVSNIGWQSYTSGVAGTTGKGLPIEAFQIGLKNAELPGSVAVKAHVQNIGWQDWVSNSSAYAGTTGRSLRVEALQLKLTDEMAQNYDIYYRVHVANVGWMAWAKNGESAGTQGYGRAVEAIEVKLVKKGGAAPSASGSVTSDAFRRKPVSVNYQAHVSNVGWMSSVSDGATGGTTGQSHGLEDVKVSLSNAEASGSIEVNAHVSNIGWQGWDKPSASEGGTTGQSKHIEALQFRLTGEMANLYDVYYRVHASNIGWMGWAKDGESAGTQGLSNSLEAVQIKLVKKGVAAPGSTDNAFLTDPVVTYSAASADGWSANATTGNTCGTTANQKDLYGFRATLDATSGVGTSLKYRVHVANKGWESWVDEGETAGSESAVNAIQALQISMSGNLTKFFDIYYRVYIDTVGWTGWAKNGATAGSTGCGLNIRAVQINFRVKGSSSLGGTSSFDSLKSLPYVGYQNPAGLYQVSNHSVNIKNLGSGQFGYRTESRIPYNATRNQLIQTMITRAMDYLNTPYKWDYACAPGVGIDCAGLVMQALYADGMDLSPMNPWDHYYTPGHDHYANDIRNNPRFRHVSFAQRQPGDLIMTNGHVSIYIGNDQVIEAYPPRVQISSVYSKQNRNVLAVVRPIV